MIGAAGNIAQEEMTGASMIGIQDATAELLWSRAGRLAAVQAYGITDVEISERIEREIVKLNQQQEVIRGARVALAKATLPGGVGRREWEQVVKEFQRLRHLLEADEKLDEEGL